MPLFTEYCEFENVPTDSPHNCLSISIPCVPLFQSRLVKASIVQDANADTSLQVTVETIGENQHLDMYMYTGIFKGGEGVMQQIQLPCSICYPYGFDPQNLIQTCGNGQIQTCGQCLLQPDGGSCNQVIDTSCHLIW